MPSLTVLDAFGTPAFVESLRAAWDRGDAVLPLDPRLPPPARADVLDAARVHEPVAEGDALVIPTSGTSGGAKAAVLTHEALRAAALAVSRRMEVEPGRDRWLACLPVAHIGGMAVVVRALVTGTALDLHAAFDPDAVNASGATLTSVVPTMLDRGVRAELFRLVLVGGDADRRERGPSVVHTYGMTETVGGIVHRGRPVDGAEVRADGEGQLHVRGPMTLRCYRDGTDPKDAEGWLPTGDLGAVVDGEVQVHGRMSDVIVTGGEKVLPTRVEQALRHHPRVKEVAVAGEPDAEWGQRVVAWVVARRPGAPPTLASLREVAKETLPAYCAPKDMVLVAELPKTPLGKTRRTALCR